MPKQTLSNAIPLCPFFNWKASFNPDDISSGYFPWSKTWFSCSLIFRNSW
ncbi:EC1118_1J19_0958p [Saccharomyces cerevisiae EC1118]|uniref:Putative uncharacterized protein YJR140W-A n=2 Tax=Saccharomyces cerevisiae TaxID=4932 RepID=YJ140_YEAST|nr:RecName: Full=Putative uncharacterized protein YJR140W-A [Saccharomyces cerevisiae S288C]AAL79272.1 unknown [Saccharomyces cerevisiae]WNV73539.1 hypothetical protein O6U65_1468 [Saccharomyces cerevisiae synthetic construct]CAY80856.1 EC1118_1J19_0958p [Saccharomyces cerevisiae EC1118]